MLSLVGRGQISALAALLARSRTHVKHLVIHPTQSISLLESKADPDQ